MAYINTSFLPKTNGKVFGERLVARSDKGRIPGLGQKLALRYGVNWVTPEPFLEGETVTAHTASWDHVEPGDIFRYRTQTRPAGGTTITNGSWTTYDGTGQDVTIVLPTDTTLEVRFQSQGKDVGNDNAQTNSMSGWRVINEITP